MATKYKFHDTGLSVSRNNAVMTHVVLVALGLAFLSLVLTPTNASAASFCEMYRLYNPNSGEHFYTSSIVEREHLKSVGWNYEGIGWYAPTEGNPVYRLYNPNAGDHHYTLSRTEHDYLVSVGWRPEGVGWASADEETGIALYRQYNPNAIAGSHNYTSSKFENDSLVSKGWMAEGIGWYGENIQQSACVRAQNLLSEMPYSRKELVEKLVSEGYSQDVASTAVDTSGANWNEQALLRARHYHRNVNPMTRAGQLSVILELYYGFTNIEANYAIEVLREAGEIIG